MHGAKCLFHILRGAQAEYETAKAKYDDENPDAGKSLVAIYSIGVCRLRRFTPGLFGGQIGFFIWHIHCHNALLGMIFCIQVPHIKYQILQFQPMYMQSDYTTCLWH